MYSSARSAWPWLRSSWRKRADGLRGIDFDAQLPRRGGVEPGLLPGHGADAVQPPPGDVLEAAEPLPEWPTSLGCPAAQQAAALEQLPEQESELQQQVI